jgi:hypothetical protein
VAFWPNQARPVTHRRQAVDETSRGGWRQGFMHVLVDEITRGGKATTAQAVTIEVVKGSCRGAAGGATRHRGLGGGLARPTGARRSSDLDRGGVIGESRGG